MLGRLIRRAIDRLWAEICHRALTDKLRLGRGSYIGWPLKITSFPGDEPQRITIGNYSSIAGNIEFIIGGNHRTDCISTFPFPEAGGPFSRGPIVIGSDVWIGRNALVLSGVRIGHGAVVGAGSIVTRNVRPYAVVAGNPAREHRRRFSDSQIEALLAIEWWNWPQQEVRSLGPLLASDDVEALISYARRRSQISHQAVPAHSPSRTAIPAPDPGARITSAQGAN